jgi:hypothetical protein
MLGSDAAIAAKMRMGQDNLVSFSVLLTRSLFSATHYLPAT